jgi:hypothetical protein
MNDPREDTVDAYLGLGGPPANDIEPHIGMNGRPCRCTPERRAHYTRGCHDTCPCHGLPHAKCPKAKPCLGDCGRVTAAHETIAGGYCIPLRCCEMAADRLTLRHCKKSQRAFGFFGIRREPWPRA